MCVASNNLPIQVRLVRGILPNRMYYNLSGLCRFSMQVLKKVCGLEVNWIHWPEITAEFEIQAELYCQLKGLGYKVRGGVLARCQEYNHYPKCYLDLVVYNHLQIAKAIIEVKNNGGPRTGGRQFRRYSLFKLPLLYCTSMESIPKVIDEVTKLAEQF